MLTELPTPTAWSARSVANVRCDFFPKCVSSCSKKHNISIINLSYSCPTESLHKCYGGSTEDS